MKRCLDIRDLIELGAPQTLLAISKFLANVSAIRIGATKEASAQIFTG
jgi:hypothetical protein